MSGPSTWVSTREAEHAVAASHPSATTAGTHFSSTSTVLVTVEVDGAVQVLGDAGEQDVDRVRALHTSRTGGRLFVFAGHAGLRGVMSVGELVAGSAVEDVVMIGARERVPDEQLVDTQSFVRPQLVDGVVRLVVRPAADGLVVPFEQPNPTPCCADH